MNTYTRYTVAILIYSLSGGLVSASATAINSAVSYSDITESSGTDEDPLYHTPTVQGDTLNFDPVFSAYAAGAGGNASDITDGQLGFDVCVAGDHVINELWFSERGDYSLLSFGHAALVDISATFFVEVLEVDGAPLAFPVNRETQMSFSPNPEGRFMYTSFGTLSGIWTGSASFDIDMLLVDSGIPFVNGATKVHMELDNTLQALAQTDSEAYVASKDFQIHSVTSAVNAIPEPVSMVLVTGASSMLIFIRRRFCI